MDTPEKEPPEHLIVCGIDGSAAAQRALDWAVFEAIQRGCKLRVVTAWSWDGVESLGAASTPAAALLHARQIQESALSQALADVENPPEVERLFPRAAPSQALCEAAANAELMVLGSHGHGMFHDKLIGSTSERAIHHAPCPVVVIPDPRHVERDLRHRRRRRRVDAPRTTPMF